MSMSSALDISEWTSINIDPLKLSRYHLSVRGKCAVWFRFLLNRNDTVCNELPYIFCVNDYQSYGRYKEKYNIRIGYPNIDSHLFKPIIDQFNLNDRNFYQFNSLTEAMEKADAIFLIIQKRLLTLKVFL